MYLENGNNIITFVRLNKPISAIVTHFDPTDTARQIANAHKVIVNMRERYCTVLTNRREDI
ncbi:hypothetical protein FE578_19470 [Clostridioides difficile]|nr:hypothetical protein [Clostridioides difficile]